MLHVNFSQNMSELKPRKKNIKINWLIFIKNFPLALLKRTDRYSQAIAPHFLDLFHVQALTYKLNCEIEKEAKI